MNILKNVSLKDYTTFRLGGRAHCFINVTTVAELREALEYAKKNTLQYFILGDGSNTVFRDEGYSGLIIHIAIKGIEYEEDSMGDARCIASAGELWDKIVADTTGKGLWGLENLSAIPGTVGAAPVQNIGAYGVEVKDVIDWVEVLDTETNQLNLFTLADCFFGYRDSVFKHAPGAHYIVTKVAFRLKTHPTPQLEYRDVSLFFDGRDTSTLSAGDIRNAIVEIRSRKLPDVQHVGTAGSFFKNPIINRDAYAELERWLGPVPSYEIDADNVKIQLAWLLEKFEWKGRRVGTMGCWDKQPLCVVHYGNGKTYELLSFTKSIAQDIKARANITLEPEVCIVS